MVVTTDYVGRGALGQDGFEDTDHMQDMANPITKWQWLVETTEKVPEITRRALKFASTPPCGPVFLAYPSDILEQQAQATVMDQSKFTVSMRVRPDPALVEQAARLLLEARNPLLYVGDEIVWCGAQKEVVELAELLGLPVMRPGGLMGWSRPFPTAHPLHLGEYLAQPRYPGKVDVMLNLGSRMPYGSPQIGMLSSTKFIQVRLDPTNLGRVYPAEVAMMGDLKLAIADLLASLRSMATAARLKQISEPRMNKTREYTVQMREYRRTIGLSRGSRSSISYPWLGLQLENVLDKNTCFVAEVDGGRVMEGLLSFGGNDKQYFGNGGVALGWGLPASFGVKLAHPELPVVAVVGDGAFLFSGPQPLWSIARYQAAVTVIVLNNRSYDAERTRIWGRGGRQTQAGRDMVCYLGNPDMDFAKMASSFGVEAEIVEESSQVGPALERAKRANSQGSPYLLDMRVERSGMGAQSTWHPPFSVEALRRGRT